MPSLPVKRLILFTLISSAIAYGGSLTLYTGHIVFSNPMLYDLSVIAVPIIFLFAGIWYFRPLSREIFNVHLVSAAVWSFFYFLLTVALISPVYDFPIMSALEQNVLLGHLLNFGALLLAGFLTRKNASGEAS